MRKMVKDSDLVVKLLGNVLNRLQQTFDRETFKERAKSLKKKINDNDSIVKFLENVPIQLSTKQLIVTFLGNVPTDRKKKEGKPQKKFDQIKLST